MADQPAIDRFEGRERIDFVVIEFPGGKVASSGFARLIELSNAERILVLDVEFIARAADGTIAPVAARDLGTIDGVDLAFFDSAMSQLLSSEDIQEIGQGMAVGSIAVIVVYQELSMNLAISAWREEGARMLEAGPAEVEALTAALNAG